MTDPIPTHGSRSNGAALLLPLLLCACGGGEDTAATNARLWDVVRGDLHITVKENAELQAVRETVVRSQVEGQATIIYLIPEGTFVQKGEKLVELDVSELVEKRANQAISVAKAFAALTQAQKAKEILQKELRTNENTARSTREIARMEVEKFVGSRKGSSEGKNADMVRKLEELVQTAPSTSEAAEGSEQVVSHVDPRSYRRLVDRVRSLLQEAVASESGDGAAGDGLDRDMGDLANRVLRQVDAIQLAMASLKIKEETLGHSRRLAARNFITRNELERDQLEWQSQVSQVTLAWNELDLLINYDLPKEQIELIQKFANADLELERVLATNEAEVTRADSELASQQAEYTLAKERLDNLDKQIGSAVMLAPTPGLVVYALLDRNRRGGEAVREGVQVRDRQELIVLPDTTKMRCLVKVQEAQVSMVRPGQIAYVQAEARPGEVYTGRVTFVAPTADSNSGWMSSDRKVYTTFVDIDGDNSDGALRSRMAATVTINIDTVRDTLPVPLQAVFRDRSVNYVWKRTAEGPVATRVEVGRHNSERVEILDGLRPGDMIYLTPPVNVQAPQFEQPVLPEPAPQPASPDPNAPAGTSGGGDEPGPAAGIPPGPENGGARNGRAPGGRNPMKRITDMTDEERAAYPARIRGMVERSRSNGNEEAAASVEAVLAELQKALDAQDIAAAQAEQDRLFGLMRSLTGGRRNGGERGEGGRRERGDDRSGG